MSKKQTTVLMAAVLTVATVLAAGLTVLPGSVQEAQANPCSVNQEVSGGDVETGGGDNSQSGSGTSTGTGSITTGDQNCDFTGPVEFDED